MENLLFQELLNRDVRLKEKGVDLTNMMADDSNSSSALIKEIKDGFDLMIGIEKMIDSFSSQVKIIFTESRKVKFLTTNMSISTERLKDQGAVLSVISIKFGDISNEIRQGVTKVNNQFSKFREILSQLRFLIAISRFQIEMMFQLAKEKPVGATENVEFDANMSVLRLLVQKYSQQAQGKIFEFNKIFQTLQFSMVEIKNLVSAMEMIRVSGKMEVNKGTLSQEAFTNHITHMEQINGQFRTSIKHIEDINDHVFHDLHTISESVDHIKKYA